MRRLIACLFVLLALTAACASAKPKTYTGTIVAGSPKVLASALRSLRGKPVLVNYWASWCEPCKNEMPRIVAAAKKYTGRIAFLGVDVQDDTSTAAAFARRYGMPFRSLADPNGDIRSAQKLLGLPVTQFYGADGQLALLNQGEISTSELNANIADVLNAARVAKVPG